MSWAVAMRRNEKVKMENEKKRKEILKKRQGIIFNLIRGIFVAIRIVC